MIKENFLKGIQIGLGFIFIIGFLFGIVFAIGFHSADEIFGGTFLGDYKFTGKVEYNGTLNATDATLIGNFGGGIEKTNTSICDASNEGEMRYNPNKHSYEGCFANIWTTIKNIRWNCDYIINEECWNRVWETSTLNLNSLTHTYTDTSSVSNATAFAFGYMNSAKELSTTYFTNDSTIISMLKTQTPFNYAMETHSVTMYNINTKQAFSGDFKFGNQIFNSACSHAWQAGNHGRICFTGKNDFPHYNSFAKDTGDWCPDSSQAFNAVLCSSEKTFVILARVD